MSPLLLFLYFFVGVKFGSSGLVSTAVFAVGGRLDLVVLAGGSSIVLSIISCASSV